MQQNMTGVFSLPCSQTGNLAAYLRVKIDPSFGLALAGAADVDIGVLANTWVATGLGSSKYATVCGSNAGVVKYTANGAITQYSAVYAAGSGLVGPSGSLFLGYTLDAATANGDVIRVSRDWPRAGNTSSFGLAPVATGISADQTSGQSNATLLAARLNVVSTSAAAGYVKLPVPAAGEEVKVVNGTGQTIHLYGNASETINGTAGATGVSLTTGQTMTVVSDGTNWFGSAAA